MFRILTIAGLVFVPSSVLNAQDGEEARLSVIELPQPDLSQAATPKNQRAWAREIQANYPYSSLRYSQEGTVGVKLTVNPLGRVEECAVTVSSGYSDLDIAACNGSRKFARFNPALDKTGEPTTGSYSMRITYMLPDWPVEDQEYSREVAPRNQEIWARRIANNFPSITIRRPLEGTVGVRVIVGANGRVWRCEASETSGESILDRTACASMFRYARFDPALDTEGNPATSVWRTQITYRYDYTTPSQARAAQPLQIAEWAKQIADDYPDEARANKWTGVVGIHLIVGVDGLVESCAVTSSTGHKVLDAAACIGAKKYARFEPALNDTGEPTRGSYSTRVTFRPE